MHYLLIRQMGFSKDTTMESDAQFRAKLAAVAAKELLDAKWLKGVQADAKAITDICIGQASTAVSKAVCSSDDMERAQDLVSALGPEFFRSLSAAMLCSTILVSKHIAKTYVNHTQN